MGLGKYAKKMQQENLDGHFLIDLDEKKLQQIGIVDPVEVKRILERREEVLPTVWQNLVEKVLDFFRTVRVEMEL